MLCVSGVFLTDCPSFMTNVTLQRNSATQHGGALFSDSASFTLERSLIDNNIAGASGGGLVLLYGSPRIVDSTVTGNIARHGGGFWLDRAGQGSPPRTEPPGGRAGGGSSAVIATPLLPGLGLACPLCYCEFSTVAATLEVPFAGQANFPRKVLKIAP